MSHFDQYLADFALSGNRYNLLPRLTASGKASGMSADEIVERIRAVGVHDRDADVRRLFNGSTVDANRRSSSWRPARPPVPILTPAEREEARRRLLPKSARDFVPVTLRNYCRRPFDEGGSWTGTATADVFGEAIRMTDEELVAAGCEAPDYPKQAARHLRAVFRPGDLIWAGNMLKVGDEVRKIPFDGRKLSSGGGVVEAYDLAKRIETRLVATIPTHISLNPVTGKPGKTTAGGISYNCKETVARYCNALLEWDDLKDVDAQGVKIPSQEQIDIAAALADYSFTYPEKMRVVAIHWTGGKSIHTVLRVRGGTLEEYERQLARLKDLFASADEPRFRVDLAPFRNHATLFRLAGAIRPETGRRARLLWADDSLATPDFSTPPCNPHGDPLTAYCGVCQEIGRCPYASKDAQVGTTAKA